MRQEVIFSNDVGRAVDRVVGGCDGVCRVFVLVDDNTSRLVLPRLADCRTIKDAAVITVPAGDDNKTVDTLREVWRALQDGNATRRSLLVNLGGGMVTDLGGFAAATFKRGMRFVNVPTTLLGAVDAAVGGKTGVNFGGLKNEIGVFAPADAVVVSTCFFDTLPQQELRSGFAEMLKHAMLTGEAEVNTLLDLDFDHLDLDRLLTLLEASVEVKRAIVERDPLENGERRVLNLGHTVGHAFEALSMERGGTVPHGCAVAWGLVVESVLSHLLKGFSSTALYRLSAWVKSTYGAPQVTCDDYPGLLRIMQHDKKSRAGEINCTLLCHYGDASVDNTVSEDDMKNALDIYRDLAGI